MKTWMIQSVRKVLEKSSPLELKNIPAPKPGPSEILIKVSVCGICHTELDEIEGRTPPPVFPMIPGHQVIGTVVEKGPGTGKFNPGDRVGIGWIFSACGQCGFCLNGMENLCAEFRATGRDVHGGYAEYMIAKENFCFNIPDSIPDEKAAPLFCAGAIGFRSLNLACLENGMPLGLSGFGASAHLVLKMAKYKFPDSDIYVFARNEKEQKFAMELGAAWSGNYDQRPPVGLYSIIDTTPAWKPVIKSLEYLRPGGRLVINAIRKENQDHEYLLNLKYSEHLWMEKEIKSVANITRKDITEFLALSVMADIQAETEVYEFANANLALTDLKMGKIRGAKVLVIK